MPQWGSTTTDESKPKDTWLSTGRGDKLANVFATSSGWVMRWPWGDEILVGIGGLNTNLGVPTHVGIELVTSGVSNISPATVAFRLLFNEGVAVSGSPTLRGITSAGPANISLVYDSTQSDPTAGKLVFANTTAVLNTAVAGNGSITITVNTTSVFDGSTTTDLLTANAVANALVTGSASVTIAQYKPGLAGIVAGANPGHTASETLSIEFDYNEAVTITGVPTVVLIASNASHANVTASYNAASSNTSNGQVVFKATAVDLSGVGIVGMTFKANSTSVLTGFSGITGASGNLVQNSTSTFTGTITVG
jgi:hypothetical protein